MQTRVAVMSIILEDTARAEEINTVLHIYGQYIIGRMGIPYRQKNIHIISVAVDAPPDVISAMAGKLGRIDGVNIKTAYSRFTSDGEAENA
jgi:putative iron-only hydrogenase system regulator